MVRLRKNDMPEPMVKIFELANSKIAMFNDLYHENFKWLQEIKEAAENAFGSSKITLLPKTPSNKRKRPDLTKTVLNDPISSADYASTFVDGGNSKKLKIDDMSAIEEDSSIIEILDISSRALRFNARQLRSSRMSNGKKKPSDKILKPSVKELDKGNLNEIADKKRSPMKMHTPENKKANNIIAENKEIKIVDTPSPIQINNGTNSSSENIAPSSPELESSRISMDNTNHNVQPKVAALIEQLKSSVKKQSETPNKVIPMIEKDQVGKEANENRRNELAERPKKENTGEIINFHVENEAADKTFTLDIDSVIKKTKNVQDNYQIVCRSPEKRTNIQLSFKDHNHDEKDIICGNEYDNSNEKMQIFSVETATVNDVNTSEEEASTKSATNSNTIPSKTKEESLVYLKNIEKTKPSMLKGGNIVTSVSSFIKRPESPPKKEDEQRKKELQLKKKEASYQKTCEEKVLQRQKFIEQRKKEREEREKRFALKRAQQIQEEIRKKQEIERKEQQVLKNREELKKQREQEEKKKRELHEEKMAKAEAKRMREEEEQRKKVMSQLEEEKKRAEMIQRKAEYEELERQRKRFENEKAEKERVRLIEEEKVIQEQRKYREFLKKEHHRLEVERKLKEEKERERIEKLQQEERLKEIEREIEKAKKIELEKTAAKERIREEIKENIEREKIVKGTHFSCKVFINNLGETKKPTKTQDLENSKNEFKYPAAYQEKLTSKKKFDPPRVPLMIRESSYTSYGIDDLASDDDTDDETDPSKRIPSWAQGNNLRIQLMEQFNAKIKANDIFINCNEPIKLEKIFQKNKARYFKRTSSAHWTSPILKK